MLRPTSLALSIALAASFASSLIAGTGSAQKGQATGEGTERASTAAVCGNGLVEPGESCKTCETDCKPLPCTADRPTYRVEISLANHPAWEATAATIHLSYRTDRFSIPGQGSTDSVRTRIDFGTSDSGITAFNDLDHSIRIVRAEGKSLPRPLVAIELDTCAGAPEPTIDDLNCVVEGCAGLGGVIEDGCTCELELSKSVRSPKSTSPK